MVKPFVKVGLGIVSSFVTSDQKNANRSTTERAEWWAVCAVDRFLVHNCALELNNG